jgi:hypothetical protein
MLCYLYTGNVMQLFTHVISSGDDYLDILITLVLSTFISIP